MAGLTTSMVNVVLVGMLVAGCSDPVLGSGGDDGAILRAGTPHSLLEARAALECEKQFRCQPFTATWSTGWTDEASCRTAKLAEWTRWANDPGFRLADAKMQQACMAAVAEMSCDAFERVTSRGTEIQLATCEVVQSKGRFANGEACESDKQCQTGNCVRELTWSEGGTIVSEGRMSDCGVCEPRLPLGAACDGNALNPCEDGLTCNSACALLPEAEREACTDSAQVCQVDTRPTYGDGNPLPTGTVALGGACESTVQCAPSLSHGVYCDSVSHTCRAPATDVGAACNARLADGATGDHHYTYIAKEGCDFTRAGLECVDPCEAQARDADFTLDIDAWRACAALQKPTCQAYSLGQAEGEACGLIITPDANGAGGTFEAASCLSALVCVYADATTDTGTCQPRKVRGETCNNVDSRGDDVCARDLVCDANSNVCVDQTVPVCR